MLKKLTLILCLVSLLTLVACKQDIASENMTSSTATQSETIGVNPDKSTDQITSSGIALEDDVFDESKNPIVSAQNSQPSIDSSQKESQKDTTTTTENESTKQGATDSDATEEIPSESEPSQATSSDELTVEDGVVKLPVDRFN